MLKSIVLFSALFILSFTASGQERELMELLRKDLQSEKTTLITKAMQFSTEEAATFWPIYRNYEKSLTSINDKKLALMKEYAKNHTQISSDRASQIVNSTFSLDAQRTKLLKKYYKKFSKALTPVKAARFVQLEQQLLNLMDLKAGRELPLVY